MPVADPAPLRSALSPLELADHAERLREHLVSKRHLILETTMGPVHRAHLLVQIEALQNRVDELIWEAAGMAPPSVGTAASADLPTALVLPGVPPRVEPVPGVVLQPQLLRSLPAATGDLCT